jgi:2-haloacid dehalogenase
MEALGVPGTLITPHLMGRTIGPVDDRERQRAVVAAALDLLGSATGPGSSVTYGGVQRRELAVSETSARLALVLLDVNETLFPLRPVATRMAEVGLDGQLELWFTRILRDGFAAAAAGGFAGFRDLADHHLRELLRRQQLDATDAVVSHVLAGFDEVLPHPDVPSGLRRLGDAGVPAVALTNGSSELTRAFLDRGRLSDLVADVHDVSEVGRWKPAPEPYRFVLQRRGVAPAAAAMVAAHPWDLFGAASAGLITAWVDRDEASYPEVFGRPDVSAARFDDLIERLLVAPVT